MWPDMTVTDVERLAARAAEVDETFHMDEDAFRAFYERTARPLWAYLSRITGDRQVCDDLLQETYYRFLRAGVVPDNEAHRRNYLFRIATNLVRDAHRRRQIDATPQSESADPADPRADVAGGVQRRTDLARGLSQLKPRERDLLWLAYANGSSHREIAETLGVKTGSVKLLLFRARKRLAALLDRGPSRPPGNGKGNGNGDGEGGAA
jgi:RNA polymerase sigma-70 factor, ECF subfamily